jgi:soluble lytic murein transglycosylase
MSSPVFHPIAPARPSSPTRAALTLALLALLVLRGEECQAAGPALAAGEVPPSLYPLEPAQLAAARALAQARRDIEDGNLDGAEISLARARGAGLLQDYVSLFEVRLLLARGRGDAAAEAARQGQERHAGRPLAAAFSELLGEARLAAGDESGAREAWQAAFAVTQDAGRRAALEQRIASSRERTGSLHAALGRAQDALVSADRRLPPEGLRQTQESLSARERLEHADALLAEGHGGEAIAAYDAALEAGLDPDSTRHARRQRAHALFRTRRYQEATAAFASLLPEAEARFWRARSLARSGRTAQAIAELEAIGASADRERASWSLYLAATLLEDRGESSRAMALYEVVARDDATERGLDALWRVAWSAYRRGESERARGLFREMASRSEPLDALRPRYWAARCAEASGDAATATRELEGLVREFPLSYYGWRASERLGGRSVPPARLGLSPGPSDVEREDLLRIELLLEAELDELAREELGAVAGRVRGLEDRKSIGRLYVRSGDFHQAQRLVVDAYRELLSRGVDPDHGVLWWLSWPPAYRQVVSEVFPPDAVIEPALVWAIMREESGYRPWVTSSAGARGLLQIMPATGEHLARRKGMADFDADDLYAPRLNVALGAAYLDELGRRFPDRLSAAIGSYNAGPRAVGGWLQGENATREDDAWVEEIPYDQTRSYVKRVLRSLHVYRTLYGNDGLLLRVPAPVSPAVPPASGG